MIGGTRQEAAIFLAGDDRIWNRTLDEAGLREQVAKVAGAEADNVIAAYRRAHPELNPAELALVVLTGSNFWIRSVLLAERKQARGTAPVHMYDFAWTVPAFGGSLASPHSADVPFVFDNLGAIGATAGSPPPQALADRVANTWIAFARSGDPNNPSIPAWPAYTPDRRATMVLDLDCQVIDDLDAEGREAWRKVALG